MGGVYKGCYPDFLVIRKVGRQLVVDVVAMLPYCGRCSYYICLAASAFVANHRGGDAIAKSYLPLEADPERAKVQVVLTAAPRTAVAYVKKFLDEHAEALETHAEAMAAGAETDPFLLILSPETEAGFLQTVRHSFDAAMGCPRSPAKPPGSSRGTYRG